MRHCCFLLWSTVSYSIETTWSASEIHQFVNSSYCTFKRMICGETELRAAVTGTVLGPRSSCNDFSCLQRQSCKYGIYLCRLRGNRQRSVLSALCGSGCETQDTFVCLHCNTGTKDIQCVLYLYVMCPRCVFTYVFKWSKKKKRDGNIWCGSAFSETEMLLWGCFKAERCLTSDLGRKIKLKWTKSELNILVVQIVFILKYLSPSEMRSFKAPNQERNPPLIWSVTSRNSGARWGV